jgi:TPP-dependent trihydroxycyclohexane-1,2-dione (THcHDO) dehydratase
MKKNPAIISLAASAPSGFRVLGFVVGLGEIYEINDTHSQRHSSSDAQAGVSRAVRIVFSRGEWRSKCYALARALGPHATAPAPASTSQERAPKEQNMAVSLRR